MIRYRLLLTWIAVLALAGCRRPTPHFVEVTRDAGLDGFVHINGARGEYRMPEILAPGVALLDWNADSLLDIAAVAGGSWDSVEARIPAVRLYVNLGDGRFRDVTYEAGLDTLYGYGLGLSAGDYDNDRDPDLVLTTLGVDWLLRNDRGAFTPEPLPGSPQWSTAAVFLDADRDGWLDLYVGGYVQWNPLSELHCSGPRGEQIYCTPEAFEGVPHRFYRNTGVGGFVDQTDAAGFLPTSGKTLGAVTLDHNGDLWPDLAVANDLEVDQLYVNNGDGTFTEFGMRAGLARDARGIATAGMGIDAGHVEGGTTIAVGNFSNQMIGVWQHERGGLFADRAALWRIGGLSRQTLAFGLFWFDADLDSDLDLFVANGHIHEHVDALDGGITFLQLPHLFINNGGGRFDDIGGFVRMLGRGAAYGDLDQDGDLDVLVAENAGGLRLWRNETGGRYLRVRLAGTTSNRDGNGALVHVFIGAHPQSRFVSGGGSYLSQSERTLTFGLGPDGQADSLHVAWPSGASSALYGPWVDAAISVTEPAQ